MDEMKKINQKLENIEKKTYEILLNLKNEKIKKELVGRQELAKILSCSKATIANLEKQGVIKKIQIGNLYRYDLSEILENKNKGEKNV